MRIGLVAAVVLTACGGQSVPKPDFEAVALWAPGPLAPGEMVQATMPMPGALPNEYCIAGVMDPAPLTGFPVQCETVKDGCAMAIRNPGPGAFTFGAAHFYCRVFTTKD